MVVRPIEQADLAAATGLLEQLGYPMSPVEVNSRLTVVAAAPQIRKVLESLAAPKMRNPGKPGFREPICGRKI